MKMQDIDKIIEQVNGSMAIEGMPLTFDDKERIRKCAGDDEKVNDTIKALVKKHTALPRAAL